jgi:exopolysaccharide production protein ExoQ
MPPSLALALWFILLMGLFRFDPAKESKVSLALLVPLVWIVIDGSRLPSQWFGLQVGSAQQALQDGNALDRTILFALIAAAIGILISRSFRWGSFFAQNIALSALLSYTLASVLWSDFPFVAFKRWWRDLGNLLVILVVLSDPRPLEALRTVLRRFCYLIIPLSVVLIKYYPDIARSYDEWTGKVAYSGVQTTKDMLGTDCLVSGLFFFWDTASRWGSRREPGTKSILAVNIAFLVMTVWLLQKSDCATCRVCLLIGCIIVMLTRSKFFRRHPRPLKFLIPAGIALSLIVVFGLDMKASIASAVGRDPTFTDRTLLWSYLRQMNINPVVGTGYESFWLGDRLDQLWREFAFRPNQAHNGYLEVYLNLGIVGVALMAIFLLASYRKICKNLDSNELQASLFLAVWAVLPIYNFTTSDFGKGELMWLTFLLGAIGVPRRAEGPARSLTAFETIPASSRRLTSS